MKIEFVKQRSPVHVVIMTTVSTKILQDSTSFRSAVKTFLTRIVEDCYVDTHVFCHLDVSISIMNRDECKFKIILLNIFISSHSKTVYFYYWWNLLTNLLLPTRLCEFTFIRDCQNKSSKNNYLKLCITSMGDLNNGAYKKPRSTMPTEFLLDNNLIYRQESLEMLLTWDHLLFFWCCSV